jgi:hypothetical protein
VAAVVANHKELQQRTGTGRRHMRE